ncbi:MAG TPA: hypothetical protein VGQ45_03700 [Gaiellales bacterium]|nr:hypothetical protein [Gaiellales bacterium]
MRRPIPLVARSLAVLALFAAATATLPSSSGGSPSRARAATAPVGTSFPRPTMTSPITIPLHVGSDSLQLDDSRDYILVMPSQKKTGPLYIRGGHNVEVIGGFMSTTTKGPNINISDDSGTRSGRIVHIEGVLIDGSSGVPSDGIKIQAPNTIVQLENDRIVGLWGTLGGYHADVVQPGGGVKELRIDGLTGASHYNDLYLRREANPLEPPIGKVTIRNTNMFGYVNSKGTSPATTIRGISIGTQSNPPSDDSQAINCTLTDPLVLDNFWITPPTGVRPGQFEWPDDNMEGAASWCDSAFAAGSSTVSWPGLSSAKGGKVSGAINVGAHADFVPAGSVGLGYK